MKSPVTIRKLQSAIGVTADGKFGPLSRAALIATFTNREANAVTANDLLAIADRLGCTAKQLRAVSVVESAGGGFDRMGRPKILFERHLFWRLTDGEHGYRTFSNPKWGGYSEDSYGKLLDACAADPDAAFASCSWGKFQVLGLHWKALGYPSSFSLALSTVQSEGDHYELLARFIEKNGLRDAMRKLSTEPDACRAFAKGYNGPAYTRNAYHVKLAEAMR